MTTKGTDNRFRSLTVVGESGTPATPASGDFKLYVADDGTFYLMDDTGTPTAIGGGGFSDPMTTRGDIIVRNASNVTDRLAIGSAGKVLSSDGTDVSWQTPAASGALVLLEQHTASSSATLDFTTTISGTYDDYVFRFNGIIPATDGAMLTIRAGTGGGPTYDTGTNYPYSNFWKAVGDTTAVATWGTSGASALSTFNDSVGGGFSNVSGTCGAGQINLFAPANTTNVKIWTWDLIFPYYSDDKFYRVTGGGLYSPTTAMTAVRFLMSSGNIAAGTIRAYGVAK